MCNGGDIKEYFSAENRVSIKITFLVHMWIIAGSLHETMLCTSDSFYAIYSEVVMSNGTYGLVCKSGRPLLTIQQHLSVLVNQPLF